jgi:tetratricopeptide (TPR) repeat protein
MLQIESPQVSTSLNNIALIYQTQGRYAEAEALYTQALNNYDRYITSDFYTLVTTATRRRKSKSLAASQRIYMVPMFYNLAGLYRAQGDVSQAITTLREGIAIEEVSLDISLANLGNSDRIAQVAKLAKYPQLRGFSTPRRLRQIPPRQPSLPSQIYCAAKGAF